MKLRYILIIFFQVTIAAYGQDNSFSFVGAYKDEASLFKLADSMKRPLLISENKIYVIGSSCITRLFDSSISNRNGDGDSNERYRDGDADERKSGGGIADRNRKGKNNHRDDDGDVNERNKGASSDSRNAAGAIAEGPRCSYTKSGKILLYTRQDINPKKSRIYYANNFYSNKYFKIIKL